MDLGIKRKRKVLYDQWRIKYSGLTTVKAQEMEEKLIAMGDLVERHDISFSHTSKSWKKTEYVEK